MAGKKGKAQGPLLPRRTVRIFAIEALLYALPRRCRGFVAAVRANGSEFSGLFESAEVGLVSVRAVRAPGSVEASVLAFGDWLARSYPALAWMRTIDPWLRPPFANDHGLTDFARVVVPWIMADRDGEPPRTRLTWARENALIDLPYRDWLHHLHGPANATPMAPLVIEVGESETRFVARAREHAQARARDLQAYLSNDPQHPLHLEDARLVASGWRHERLRVRDQVHLTNLPTELDRHAEWWALRNVEGLTHDAIAERPNASVDVSTVRKGIKAVGEYFDVTRHERNSV